MAASSREARRKKILERGNDRLALITGRIQTVPPSPTPEPDSTSSSLPQDSLPPLSSPPFPSHPSDRISAAHDGEEKPSSSLLPEHNPGSEPAEVSNCNGEQQIEAHLHSERLRGPSSEVDYKEHSPVVPPTVQGSVGASQWSGKRSDRTFFSQKQINSAIAASESTRFFCSATIALLVVLSHGGFLSSFQGSFAFSRPLLLVLLTNLTVMIARLLLEKQSGLRKAHAGPNQATSEAGSGWVEQVSKVLEIGLILQKVIDSLFMDCSVYAIVVICGLSLASAFS